MSKSCDSCKPDTSVLLAPVLNTEVSHHFTVSNKPVRITAVNLADGDCIMVERIIDICDEITIAPAYNDCCEVTICHSCPAVTLVNPGTYRVTKCPSNTADDGVIVLQEPIEAPITITTGGSSMSCGLTVADVSDLISAALAAHTDVHVTQIDEAASGWNVILSDGSTILLTVRSDDGTIDVVGGNIQANALGVANAICDDADAVAALNACLNTGGGGGTTDGVITGVSDPDASGVVTITTSTGGTYTFDISTYVAANAGGGGTADGVINSVSDPDASGIVTVTTSTGGTYTFNIAAYVAANSDLADGVVVGVSDPDAAGVITVTMADGSTFTTDVSTFVNDNDNYLDSVSGPDADGIVTLTMVDGSTETIDISQFVFDNACCPSTTVAFTFPNMGDTSDLLRALVDGADDPALQYADDALDNA